MAGTAANTYTGTTTVNGGTLQIGMQAAVASLVGPVVVNSGGTVQQTGNFNGELGAQPWIINGGVLDLSPLVANNPVFTDTVTALLFPDTGGTTSTVNVGNVNLTLSRSLWVQSGSVNITGLAGALLLNTASTIFDVASGASLNVSATIAGAAAGNGLTEVGGGTLTLSGSTANTFQAGTNINEGTLVLAKTASVAAIPLALSVGDFNGGVTAKVTTGFSQLGPVSNPVPLYLQGGGTLDISGSTAVQSIATLDMRGGTVLTGSNTLTVDGAVTALAIGTVSSAISGNLLLGTTNGIFSTVDSGTTPGLVVNAQISGAPGSPRLAPAR